MGSSLQNNSKMKFLLVSASLSLWPRPPQPGTHVSLRGIQLRSSPRTFLPGLRFNLKERECSDGEGFGCIGEILGTVMSCIAAAGMNPVAVFTCVTGVINAASDCYDCICWVMSYAGIDCP